MELNRLALRRITMQSLVQYGGQLIRSFVSGGVVRYHSQNYAKKAIPRPLSLLAASSGISKGSSHPQIVSKWSFGDDAYFVAKNRSADVIGVADGVGGWREYGVDPSQFPRTLMSVCERLVNEGRFTPQEPKDIICKGYREMLEHKAHLVGSCTALLVALDKEDKTLYSANLGDSGFLVIREGEIVHRSIEQQHYFNTPFQLAVAPTVLEGVVLSDSPESADTLSFDVEVGDIVVVGTDGLFDNMSDDLILHHTSTLKESRMECVQKVANLLARAAHELAFDSEYMSPFALQAAQNGFQIKGGKPDDITVVLAQVTREGLVTS